MLVVAITPDLLIGSKLEAIATGAGATYSQIAHPRNLPSPATVNMLLIDWGAREPDWQEEIVAWREAAGSFTPRTITFGPHTDLAAHNAAQEAGIGPMRARSWLFEHLPGLLGQVTH